MATRFRIASTPWSCYLLPMWIKVQPRGSILAVCKERWKGVLYCAYKRLWWGMMLTNGNIMLGDRRRRRWSSYWISFLGYSKMHVSSIEPKTIGSREFLSISLVLQFRMTLIASDRWMHRNFTRCFRISDGCKQPLVDHNQCASCQDSGSGVLNVDIWYKDTEVIDYQRINLAQNIAADSWLKWALNGECMNMCVDRALWIDFATINWNLALNRSS